MDPNWRRSVFGFRASFAFRNPAFGFCLCLVRTKNACYIIFVADSITAPASAGAAAATQFGRFYLQELINSGGMAEIWLATDSKNKPYALRKLHDRLRFNLSARRRFV